MNKFFGFLGLVRKSGRVIAGGNLTEKALSSKKLSLVILATDASFGTKKKFKDGCAHKGVEVIEVATMDELGSAIGKGPTSVIGISEEKMANKLKELTTM